MTTLAFEDFAHFYADAGMGEAASREHFAALSSFLTYLRDRARRIDPTQTALGISWRGGSDRASNAVESSLQLHPIFEEATAKNAARKP